MYIYCIENLTDGRRYVGQSQRDSDKTKSYYGSGVYIRAAIKRHGKANFRKTILEDGLTADNLGERERHWVGQLGTLAPNGYNLTTGGEVHYQLSAESIERGASKNRLIVGPLHWAFGKHFSPEHRQAISASLKGQSPSPEARKKISECLKGRDCLSPESRARVTAVNTGKKRSPESIEKMRMQRSVRAVAQIDLTTGQEIARFRSIAEAARQSGCNGSAIHKCLTGELKKTNGYAWKDAS